MTPPSFRTLRLLLVLVLLSLPSRPARADDARVTLQLKWRHQFQFAGYYMAQEQGYYAREGLDVQVVAAKPGTDPVDEVLSGRAQYGVGASELGLAFAQGKPVRVLGVVFQHSPLTLFARRASGIESVHDLKGKVVAAAESEAELFAYLLRESVPRESLKLQTHDFSVDSLLSGKVDVLAGYDTDETWWLRDDLDAYLRLSPRSSGLDFYGDTLFTSLDELERHPARAVAFRRASLEGWKWALEHRDEAVTLIHSKYAPDLPREKLAFEAERAVALVRADLVELGYSYPGRWKHILAAYADVGLLPRAKVDVDLAGFVVPPEGPATNPWPMRLLLLVLIVGVACGLLAVRYFRRSKTLQDKLARVEGTQVELRQQALHDPLTGLHNRRAFEESAVRELARAKRERIPLTLALIDLDHFKQLNDTAGHAAGDATLVRLAKLLSFGRATDLPCRFGGEEFVVVMPNTQAQDVVQVATRWLDAFSKPDEDGRKVTFSVGVAAYPLHGDSMETLLAAADKALYQAKAAGRARVRVAGSALSSSPVATVGPPRTRA